MMRALSEEWSGEQFLAESETLRAEVLSPASGFNTLYRFFGAFFLIEIGSSDLAKGILAEEMHLNSRRATLGYIASTLRRLGEDPLEKYRKKN